MSDRYETDSLGRVTAYKARCPWCNVAPLFIHKMSSDMVLCDACDGAWAPLDEEKLFTVHPNMVLPAAPRADTPNQTP
jgi:hypothetical protein